MASTMAANTSVRQRIWSSILVGMEAARIEAAIYFGIDPERRSASVLSFEAAK
jgi:hypothetical protein